MRLWYGLAVAFAAVGIILRLTGHDDVALTVLTFAAAALLFAAAADRTLVR